MTLNLSPRLKEHQSPNCSLNKLQRRHRHRNPRNHLMQVSCVQAPVLCHALRRVNGPAVSPFLAQPAPVAQQPFPYGAVPDNPMVRNESISALGAPSSPGLAPMEPPTCPAPSCPDTCAPLCARSCCAGMNLLPQTWDKRAALPVEPNQYTSVSTVSHLVYRRYYVAL
ncbi:hypothetical protein OS493_029728 [Desmophyllum pertusum]|uniref:Uncharacterized protein n=1 Tax=Desmophyllum pertusum TaxID=174260 RepID=A0A9X0CXS8_9CNID|nr:hypothetical protein OS493_029728 [Desmophyllum pertusum]